MEILIKFLIYAPAIYCIIMSLYWDTVARNARKKIKDSHDGVFYDKT